MQSRISWLRAALKDFEGFPEEVRREMVRALRVAANGEGRHRQAHEGVRLRRLRDRLAASGRRLQDRLRLATRPGCVGAPHVPEEVEKRRQDAQAGDRPDPGEDQTLEGAIAMSDD